MGWSVQLFQAPDRVNSVDPELLVTNLKLLQPQAIDALATAVLRPQYEIEWFSALCLAVRHGFQRQVLPPDRREALDLIWRKRLTALGLNERDIEAAQDEASVFVSTSPDVKGIYLVRALAAEWLLDKSDDDDRGPNVSM